MKATILYSTFLDHDGKKRVIGGIETYLLNLARVCQEMNIEPTIFQWARQPFNTNVDGIKVKGVPVMHLPYHRRPYALFRSVVNNLASEKDLIIFGTDAQSVRSAYRRTISIQHGISWDLPPRFMSRNNLFHRKPMGYLYKAWLRRRFIRYYENCPNRVCVDYNFPNWYRTFLVCEPQGRDWVIPNFTDIPSAEKIKHHSEDSQPYKILFARRFCEFRGTRIMAEATKHILASHQEVSVTYAGEGADEKWLRDCFAGQARVTFIKYRPQDTLDIHLQHHIAVIPSLASEGTSLSVAEAMACGCAVVATNIGGITNMLIDGYNGLIVSPNIQDVVMALERLLDNPQLVRQLGARAYDVAANGFSYGKWKDRWEEVIETVLHDKL